MKIIFQRLALFISTTFFCTSCSHVFYQPDRHIYYPPEQFKFKKEDVPFKAKDGTDLFAWYFPSEQKTCKGTIVQFHGNGENISSHYTALVWLVREGYSLFTFDYRSYGASRGDPDQANVNDDSLTSLSLAYQLHEKNHCGKFVVYGQSLGGVIAMRALADWPMREKVSLIVMDSTFMSYKTVARQALTKHWLTWIFSPLGWLLVSNKYGSNHVIDQIRNPLLVIHDRKDPTVNFSNGENLFKTYNGPKDFWDFIYGSHIGYFGIPGLEANRKRFVDYLNATR